MIMIMKTSDQVTTEPRRSTRACSAPEWYGNPVLEVMLLDHDEPTNYEEAMTSPDTSILHHAFILIFIALRAVIRYYISILMPILSYFTRFT